MFLSCQPVIFLHDSKKLVEIILNLNHPIEHYFVKWDSRARMVYFKQSNRNAIKAIHLQHLIL